DANFADQLAQSFWQRFLESDRKGTLETSDSRRLGGLAHRMLYNLFVDSYRSAKRRRSHLEGGADVDKAADARRRSTPLSRVLASTEPLPEADMQVIRGWPVRDRLMLLCWVGLWRRVPEAHWDRWTRELDLA